MPSTADATARGVVHADWNHGGGNGWGGGNGGPCAGQSWQHQQPWWPGSQTPPWQPWGPWQGGQSGESVLFSFPAVTSGQSGNSPLALTWGGVMYGTTLSGGNANGGVAFQLCPSQSGYQETVIYNFGGATDPIGNKPGPLSMDWQGNLWGNSSGGVFVLTPTSQNTWTGTLVYPCKTGRQVYSRVLTLSGGSIFAGCNNTLAKISPNGSGGWTATTLVKFTGPNGLNPNGPVVVDWYGNIWGTTRHGGSYDDGVAYELTPGQSGYTQNILYTFNPASGAHPSSIIFDRNGNMYGTTVRGNPDRNGTVFELSPNGTGGWGLTVIDAISGGSIPKDAPLMDAWGDLFFATTENAGGGGAGALLELTSSQSGWTESTLYNFPGADNGSGPYGTMLWSDWSGNLYGTTLAGGTGTCPGGCGTVWEYGFGGGHHGGGWGQGGWGNGWGYCGGNGNNNGQNNGWGQNNGQGQNGGWQNQR